ncbi:MAG TPA: hypothetical protein VEN82_05010, partial [Actinomycetota bacterium]|nr:hypothetical protein [Actinomycetota bacterium]
MTSPSRAGAVEFGIGIPQVQAGPGSDVGSLRRFLVRAEALGFDSAWVMDQPIGTAPSLEPL